MIGKLPNDFSYKSASDLVRIGRDNDGGYLVSKSDIEKSDVLIGLGINDDWSFERDFKKILSDITSSSTCSKVQWFLSYVSKPTNFCMWWFLDFEKK